MKFKIIVLLLLMTFVFSSSAFACTSFALYGNQIFYGMNFDYFSIPLKFLIESGLEMNLFHLSFLYDQTVDDPEYKGYFAKTCGMNSRGLFCASQEIEPYIEGRKNPGKGEVHIDDQYEAISKYSGVDSVKKEIKGKQWIQYIGPSIHNMFADINGNAIVTETDNKENFITEIEGDFIVMSNFPNHNLAGKSYGEAEGAGAERYRLTYKFLTENTNSFTIEKGFHLLKKAYCKDKNFKTKCSMIFHPETNSAYIALNLNMERIWKVSIDQQTIETFEGYSRYQKANIGEEGILSKDLELLGI